MKINHDSNFDWIQPCLTAIKNHNINHSTGAHMGRTIVGLIGAIINDPSLSHENVISESTEGSSGFDPQSGEKKEIDLINLRSNFGQALDKVGLKLVSDAEFISEIGGTTKVDNVFIFVGNQNRFDNFVKTLDRNQIENNPELRDLISGVIEDTSRLICSPQSTGEYRAIVDAVRPLFEKLDNLNMAEQKNMFRPLVDARDGNYIPEYLQALQQQLVQDPNKGFTPENWISDPAPDDFPNRWSKAVELVYSLSENFTAMHFHSQLVKRLLEAARSSLAIHSEAKIAVTNGTATSNQNMYAREYIGAALDTAITKLEPLESPF
jgi:hypothetical protein